MTFVAEAFQLTPAEVGRIAVEGVEFTWLDEAAWGTLTVQIEETLRSMSCG